MCSGARTTAQVASAAVWSEHNNWRACGETLKGRSGAGRRWRGGEGTRHFENDSDGKRLADAEDFGADAGAHRVCDVVSAVCRGHYKGDGNRNVPAGCTRSTCAIGISSTLARGMPAWSSYITPRTAQHARMDTNAGARNQHQP